MDGNNTFCLSDGWWFSRFGVRVCSEMENGEVGMCFHSLYHPRRDRVGFGMVTRVFIRWQM